MSRESHKAIERVKKLGSMSLQEQREYLESERRAEPASDSSGSRAALCSALPCPFCWSSTTARDEGYPIQKGEWQHWWIVQCANDSCGIWASGPTQESATAKWNRRAPIAPNAKAEASGG